MEGKDLELIIKWKLVLIVQILLAVVLVSQILWYAYAGDWIMLTVWTVCIYIFLIAIRYDLRLRRQDTDSRREDEK